MKESLVFFGCPSNFCEEELEVLQIRWTGLVEKRIYVSKQNLIQSVTDFQSLNKHLVLIPAKGSQ